MRTPTEYKPYERATLDISVGFSSCDCCNTQLLRTKFTYAASWQLCPQCIILYHTNKIELNGR
jgi:hypothetical protein